MPKQEIILRIVDDVDDTAAESSSALLAGDFTLDDLFGSTGNSALVEISFRDLEPESAVPETVILEPRALPGWVAI